MKGILLIVVFLFVGLALFGCTQQSQIPVTNRINFYTPDTLPDAYVGVPYNYSFCDPSPTNVNDLCGALNDSDNPSGGHNPYHFTLGSGVGFQPLGLTLNLNGLLTGTPTVAGTKKFQVCAVDLSANSKCNDVTLTVAPSYNFTVHFTGDGSGTVEVDEYVPPYFDEPIAHNCSKDCALGLQNGSEITSSKEWAVST